MYPQLNSSDNVGVTELRMLTTAAQQADLTEVQEQQQPLNSNEDNSHSNGESVVQTRLYSNGSAAVDHSGGGGSASASRGPVPRRKVRFLQKLMNFCGDPKRREQTCNKRNRTFTLCFGFSILGLMCSVGLAHIMWFTNTFNELVIPRLALAENSQSVDWWAHPPYHTYLRVHIFNYTNVAEFESGEDDKLKIVDLGPYSYIERSEKIDVKFYPNNTITYREKKSYVFDPSTSFGNKYDPVIVPNVPLTSALEMMRTSNFIKRISIRNIISLYQAPLFKRLPADSYLWGYEDPFVDLATLANPMPFKNFGVLVLKNGTSDDVFRIHTGEDNFDKIGIIESLNDGTEMPYWKTEKCNMVEGTDGSQFAPTDIQKDKTVTVYVKDICRKFDLEFEEDVTVFGDLPAKRYRSPLDSFSYPVNDTEKQCYCTGKTCPPSGVFDASVCTRGAPIYASFPHFYSGEQSLIDKYEGINPVKELHATFADLHPRMGFPMDFASRFQINVRIPDDSPEEFLGNVQPGDILPILWMEVAPAKFPDEVQNAIYHSSFTANFVEGVLKYGSVASTAAIVFFMLYLLGAMFYLKR